MYNRQQTTTYHPGNAMQTQDSWQKYTFPVAIAVLVIFHGVGLWGLLFSNNQEYFQSLTPLNLLLTAVLLFLFHRHWSAGFILFAGIVAVVGFSAELVGVHTGFLFGNYIYGSSLGTKLWQVPLLIGLNWLILVYCTGHISDYTKLPRPIKALLGALLMVLLDFFLEPVATKYDFWNWRESKIPFSNYLGWFMIALPLQVLYQRTNMYKSNVMAPIIYVVQLVFFIVLYTFLQS